LVGVAGQETQASLFSATEGDVAEINGGSVVLDTSGTHLGLLSSNMWFKFGSTSTLNYGINPTAGACDLLDVYRVTIIDGAKAVLDTTGLGAGTPSQAWRFVTTTNGITGTFTSDVGTLPYTISKSADGNDYFLNT
jgi:hypothetical protein